MHIYDRILYKIIYPVLLYMKILAIKSQSKIICKYDSIRPNSNCNILHFEFLRLHLFTKF
jgi:hypothetical protein